MILRLASGSATPASASKKRSARVDADHVHAHVLGHRRHDLVAFLPAQQAGIDEHAGQLLADRAMQQRGHDRGIDAAREPEQDAVVADLGTHARDLVLDDVGRGPQRPAAADLGHETPQQRPALLRVRDLRMELHAVPAPFVVRHRRDRNARGTRGDDEARRRGRDVVAVAHPHVERLRRRMVAEALQQAVVGDDVDARMAELARIRGLGAATELRGQGLHAVADAEERQFRFENGLRARAARVRAWSTPGPPERMIPFAPNAAISAGSWSQAQISQ